MKRIAVIVVGAVMFLLGYGAIGAYAWPGVPDREAHYGYFHNTYDNWGDFVMESGYPASVTNATAFINFVEGQLRGGSARNKTGAAFTIQTMLAEPWNRNKPPTADQIADWESRVRRAEAHGWITWSANFTFTGNTYWQGVAPGGPNPDDDAFYYENGTRVSMIFRNSTGAVAYVIKRDCGNPLTNGYMPGLEESWNIAGHTDVSSATATPGQTIQFKHYLNNFGETGARIWYVPVEGPSSAGTGLAVPSTNTWINGGQTVNVLNENFTIPNNAAANTKYCRLIGWDPKDAWGGRNARGTEACVTVVIPAKLKAAMSTNPPTISAGDGTTFTPAISATLNASPITVNCSITRTLFPPSGSPSSLGAQPCVTTGGNPNIVIGTGASVTLRSNAYTAPDNIPIGSRICDVITITNPSSPGYYVNYPADQTAQSCVTIAKTPYVQFMGGDVWAGGGFAAVAPGTCKKGAKITTVTRGRALTSDGTTPGSGVAYGAFALGKITNFGSASVARVATTGQGDNWTFSNINSGNLGFYGATQHCIPDYVANYSGSPTLPGGTIDVAGGSNGSWRVTSSATFHGNMTPGRQKVYVVSGNVTIDNNITYPANFTAGNIPSLVIIATGNVLINANVQQIDAIIIARGTVFTCFPKVEPATINTCNNKLTINGSVLSNDLDLFRTAGADGVTPASQKAAAEVFNLSPEVYLQNALNLNSGLTITTSALRELPPRF